MEKDTILFVLMVISICFAIFSPEAWEFMPVMVAVGLFIMLVISYNTVRKMFVPIILIMLMLPIVNASTTVTKHDLTTLQPDTFFGNAVINWEINISNWLPSSSSGTCTLYQNGESIEVIDITGTPDKYYNKTTFQVSGLQDGLNNINMTCTGDGFTNDTVSELKIHNVEANYVYWMFINLGLSILGLWCFTRPGREIDAAILATMSMAMLGVISSVNTQTLAIKYLTGFIAILILLSTAVSLIKKGNGKDNDNQKGWTAPNK